MSLLGDSVNSSSVLGELRPAWGQEKGQDDSLLALLSLLAAEGFHHRRRDIGVVVYNLPFPAFTPVDVRDPPLDAYRIASDLHLAMFSAHCVRYIVGYGKDNQVIQRHLPLRHSLRCLLPASPHLFPSDIYAP